MNESNNPVKPCYIPSCLFMHDNVNLHSTYDKSRLMHMNAISREKFCFQQIVSFLFYLYHSLRFYSSIPCLDAFSEPVL